MLLPALVNQSNRLIAWLWACELAAGSDVAMHVAGRMCDTTSAEGTVVTIILQVAFKIGAYQIL